MKKLIFSFFLLALVVSAVSCSKDEDDTIVGKWVFQSVSYDIEVTPESSYDAFKEILEGNMLIFVSGLTWTFNTDGTGSMNLGEMQLPVTYTYSGENLTMTMPNEKDSQSMIFRINGRNAQVIIDETDIYDPKELEHQGLPGITVEKAITTGHFVKQ